MAILNKSKTDSSQKDCWRTPPELISDALKLLGIDKFDTDVCCEHENVSIDEAIFCIAEKDDALRSEWFSTHYKTSFCNPPFSKKWEFFEKAIEQSTKWQSNVLMVMPYTPCTKEWHANVHSENCIIYVPNGRYQFLLSDGSKPKNSCSFDVCLILIVPFLCGNVIIDYERGLKWTI